MGLPREDLLLMLRALKRGVADLKGIRKALDRRASKPISLLEALHLSAPAPLAADAWVPDPAADRGTLDSLRDLLIEAGELKAAEWERFVASLARGHARIEHPPLTVPVEFDGYVLQWEVARRERGVVYRAKDREGKDVAIKVFRKEIPLLGELPRVEGLAYAVAPFEEGETLEARGKHGLKWAVEAVAKAADLLRGTTHGALAPWRIVVRRDDRLALLGLEHAKAVTASVRTAQYGPGDDVRALGAILYEAITGSPPAGGISPAERERDVDPGLDRVVAAALTGGYASTAELADDLRRHLSGQPVTARKASTPSPAAGSGKRTWIWAAAAGIVVAAVATWLATRSPAPAPAPAPKEAAVVPRPPAAPPKVSEKKPAPAPSRPPEPSTRPLTADEDRKLFQECLQAQGSGKAERIIAAANEAVLRGSKKDWPYTYLVRAFTERDELDKALEYANRAVESWPENREFLQLRAETFVFRGQALRALADYERLHGGRAKDLLREADQLLAQAKADPQDGRTRLLLGVFQHLRRHYDLAAMEFSRAAELGQRRALAWRARARAGMEDKPAALVDVKAYLAEFPADFATEEMRALEASLR